MKTLVMFLLICAVMVLNNAADEDHILKRSISCPHGWSGYRGRCFLYISTPMTWGNAEQTCLSRGGNLASVHSFSEQNFIQSLILSLTHSYPLTWLGGSDAEQEGTWFWSDGTHFDFNYWDKGQPDNYLHAHCLLMNYGGNKKFDDQPCSRTRPFVCAMKP
ncbi:galactose-specific lectin nattectin-like [Cheilinus undulatus]|uniref:galactose-specific lectin nattectin-like n=1 Tax=Cheilinus undulatus TaxID=241271 RepID=UPI001BD27372|nr:galactose-specific lectin nattectin-like [Cheilinus undulatus]